MVILLAPPCLSGRYCRTFAAPVLGIQVLTSLPLPSYCCSLPSPAEVWVWRGWGQESMSPVVSGWSMAAAVQHPDTFLGHVAGSNLFPISNLGIKHVPVRHYKLFECHPWSKSWNRKLTEGHIPGFTSLSLLVMACQSSSVSVHKGVIMPVRQWTPWWLQGSTLYWWLSPCYTMQH